MTDKAMDILVSMNKNKCKSELEYNEKLNEISVQDLWTNIKITK